MESAARVVDDTPLRHGVVVHYHEIGLKGRNRGAFERQLVGNLERALRNSDQDGVDVLNGRLFVRTADAPSREVLDRIIETFGVAFAAPCLVTAPDIGQMIDAALALLEPRTFATFAIASRRATKDHPFTSQDINVQVGAAVQEATGAGVNLSAP